jgi:hypothetical protein
MTAASCPAPTDSIPRASKRETQWSRIPDFIAIIDFSLEKPLKISELHLVRLGKVDDESFEAGVKQRKIEARAKQRKIGDRVENLGKSLRDLLSQQKAKERMECASSRVWNSRNPRGGADQACSAHRAERVDQSRDREGFAGSGGTLQEHQLGTCTIEGVDNVVVRLGGQQGRLANVDYL